MMCSEFGKQWVWGERERSGIPAKRREKVAVSLWEGQLGVSLCHNTNHLLAIIQVMGAISDIVRGFRQVRASEIIGQGLEGKGEGAGARFSRSVCTQLKSLQDFLPLSQYCSPSKSEGAL